MFYSYEQTRIKQEITDRCMTCQAVLVLVCPTCQTCTHGDQPSQTSLPSHISNIQAKQTLSNRYKKQANIKGKIELRAMTVENSGTSIQELASETENVEEMMSQPAELSTATLVGEYFSWNYVVF